MRETSASRHDHLEAGRCEIRLNGHLESRWVGWFDGLSFRHESDGITVIHGQVVDEAALYGVLQKVRDAGLPLVSVAYTAREHREVPNVEPRAQFTKKERNPK